jgi:hypothetical protein
MTYRYRLAQAKGKRALEEAVAEDAALLRDFGARLLSVQGGLRVAMEKELRGDKVHPWNVVSIDTKTWEWVRPLLLELRKSREAGARHPGVAEVIALAAAK